MRRRFLSILLALCVVLTLVPTALAVEPTTYENEDVRITNVTDKGDLDTDYSHLIHVGSITRKCTCIAPVTITPGAKFGDENNINWYIAIVPEELPEDGDVSDLDWDTYAGYTGKSLTLTQAGEYTVGYDSETTGDMCNFAITVLAGSESTDPNLPTVENIPAEGTVYARTQTVKLDGKDVQFQCYAVKNAAGNETNYVKIRDLAQSLNGTKAQFNVGWDGKISITANTAYQAVGGEGTIPYSGDQPYKAMSNTPVSFNGGSVNLTSFSITYQGGGYTYYKLRDLGQLLGFNVTWNGGVVIETDKPYTG